MNVADIMTRRVISIAPDATVLDAVALMLKHHVSGLPVIDRTGILLGIVTEADLLRRAETGTLRKRSRWLDAFLGPADAAKSYVHSHGMKISDVMTKQVVCADERQPLDEVVHLLEIHNVKRLPVSREGKVVGIVSRANLIRALASFYREPKTPLKSDLALRESILTEIYRQSWAIGTDVDVIVRNGVADVWGTISDIEQRKALKVLIESVPGVRTVADHLRWQNELTPS